MQREVIQKHIQKEIHMKIQRVLRMVDLTFNLVQVLACALTYQLVSSF